MGLREVIEQVLPHYERAIFEMPKEGYHKWLSRKHLSLGICRFAKMVFCEDIYDAMPLTLGHTPNYFDNYEESLKALQTRVDWMKDYLL